MKKIILILIIMLFAFAGCKGDYNILEYQNSNIEASCTVNDKYNVNIIKTNGLKRLEMCSPDTLKGILFEMRGDKAFAIKDDIEIPVSTDSLKGVCALLNCFSLSEGEIATVSLNNIISFDTDYGLYTVTYGENNLPQNIKIAGDTYEYNITVNTIMLSPDSQ